MDTKKNFIFLLAGLAGITFAWLYNLANPPFSPDSWSLYELSKSIFSDFYKVNTWRQYQFPGEYSVSFPPLWPVLLGLFNSVLDLGIYAGFILNLLISMATLFALVALSKVLFNDSFYGTILYIGLLSVPGYLYELNGARTIPLSVLFLVLILILYLKENKIESRNILMIGILAGLSVLNRFDFLLAGLILGIPVVITAREKNARAALKYYCAYLVTLSPWIIYSLTKFSRVFVSDNSRTVLCSFQTDVTDYFTGPVPTVFNEPAAWLVKSLKNSFHVFGGFMKATALSTLTIFLLLLIFIFIFMVLYNRAETAELTNSDRDRIKLSKLLGFSLVIIVTTACIFIAGYAPARYFITTILYINLLLLVIDIQLFSIIGRIRIANIAFIVFFILSLGMLVSLRTGGGQGLTIINPLHLKLQIDRNNLYPNEYRELLDCLENEKDVRLFILDYAEPISTITAPLKFGALTGIKTFIRPSNFSLEMLRDFVGTYRINYIIAEAPESIDYLDLHYNCHRLCRDLPVYRLNGEKTL